ncbi:phage protein NinX family protein [Paraburkholderia nodosa]|uniref:phage protein NinX family protein n=1 Tax=Paraburkholderia nodosa TaxID=392320 RepID=UPI000841EA40|nr:phage protein NinX family protein [Paraburkholderia nodosa]
MKVSELSGALLNYWVAKADGLHEPRIAEYTDGCLHCLLPGQQVGENHWRPERLYFPSADWSVGGPIIEREEICVRTMAQLRTFRPGERCWRANHYHGEYLSTGSTFLEAAMRCFVKSKFGDDVPDEVPA